MAARITIEEAVSFVRSRMDELSAVSSEQLAASVDDRNLETTVEALLPEAVDLVHRTCPVEALPPAAERYDEGDIANEVLEDGTLDVRTVLKDGDVPVTDIVRFVSFRSGDSGHVVTRLVPEDSPAGRMQLDKWVRGRSDDPVAVLAADSDEGFLHIRYHSVDDPDAPPTFGLLVVHACAIKSETTTVNDASATVRYVETAEGLRYAVLERLAQLVMRVYLMQQSEQNGQTSDVLANNGVAGQQQNTP